MRHTLIILVLLVCLPLNTAFSENDMGNLPTRLRIVSVNDGLPQQAVSSILQDSNDFMWLGTFDGLCRYDGISFHNYHHTNRDTTSLNDNRILSTFEDSKGNIWIGTEGPASLNLYNNKEDNFIHPHAQPWVDCRSLAEDRNGIMWIGSSTGLFLLDTSDITELKPYRIPHQSLAYSYIKQIISTPSQNLWVLSADSLFCIETDLRVKYRFGGKFISEMRSVYCDKNSNLLMIGDDGLFIKEADKEQIRKTNVSIPLTAILQISDDCYVAGTERDGILILTQKGDASFDVSFPERFNKNSFFSSNLIRNFYIDHSGCLWIGSGHEGAAIIDLHPYPFHTLNMPSDERHPFVRSIFKDSQDRLWIGIKLGGLYMLHNNQYRAFPIQRNQNFNVIYEDSKHNVWICTNKNVYIYRNNSILNLKDLPGIPKDVYSQINSASTLVEDSQGTIWIGGTGKLLRLKGMFTSEMSFHYYDNPFTEDLFCMNMDKFGRLLFGSRSKGLFIITLNVFSDIISYQSFNSSNSPIMSDKIWNICMLKNKNHAWLATDAGVNILDLTQDTISIEEVNISPKLANNKVLSIVEDAEGELWFNSSQGLLRYNPSSQEYKEYYYTDGLCSNTLTEAGFMDSNGMLYLGTINGINYFNPSKIKDFYYHLKPQVIGFKIYHRPIAPNQLVNNSIPLVQSILKTKHIDIEYQNNNFSFEFIAPDYKNPHRIRYAYKLEGYDKDWNYTSGTDRTAHYNRLKPGEYTFLVKASCIEGVWNEKQDGISISIKSAPWRTWWAYSLYLLTVGIIIFCILRYYMIHYKLKRDLQIEHIQREHEQLLNNIKLRYHTNISHEIRTALTLIVTPLNDILNQTNTETYHDKLNIVQRNVEHLNHLVSQFLDLRKIDNDAMPLCVKETNIPWLIHDIFTRFKEVAEHQQINFNLICEMHEPTGWLDEDKVIKIVSNLVSNALKFTPEKGFVNILLDQDEDWCEITVEDTGCGISTDEIKNIFERYYQNSQWQNEGMGIGLALTRRLVKLHKGEISVQSVPTGGRTRFTVRIPITPDHYDQGERSIEENLVEQPQPAILHDKPTIMIVDDNRDICEYLRLNLSDKYNIITDDNAESALVKIENYIPDLILLDVMLKGGKSGIELCADIKNNMLTNHIPIVILSAKDTPEDIALGYRKGAEDYMLKPFSMDLLLMKINNIISTRSHIKGVESDGTTPDVVNAIEEQEIAHTPFFDSLMEVIHENLGDPEFSINTICDKFNVSRTQLYRKVKAITETPISTLIRDERMKIAHEMLQKGTYNISEVMYQVGISSNSYFTKIFREYFGVAPSEFVKQSIKK